MSKYEEPTCKDCGEPIESKRDIEAYEESGLCYQCNKDEDEFEKWDNEDEE